MDGSSKQPPSNFRKFFVRGLAILLPSVLTIWILLAAYQFVQSRIAEPINQGVRELVLRTSPWPRADEDALNDRLEELRDQFFETRGGRAWLAQDRATRQAAGLEPRPADAVEPEEVVVDRVQRAVVMELRRERLGQWWQSYFLVMDLIGLVIAIILIYMAGLLLGSYIGRRLYQRGEEVLNRLPLVGRVYPAVKQVTDFVVGQEREMVSFNRVVAVQYPRKGLWSVGLVTGDTMRAIQSEVGTDCMTVFIPSSPTPFTGYVITVPKDEVIDLPITIEDAMKFAVSGGVLVPPNQKIVRPASVETKVAAMLPEDGEGTGSGLPAGAKGSDAHGAERPDGSGGGDGVSSGDGGQR